MIITAPRNQQVASHEEMMDEALYSAPEWGDAMSASFGTGFEHTLTSVLV